MYHRLTTSIYLSLSYCLLVAYLSKVAEMFSFVTDGAANADLVVVEFVLASLALFSIGGQKATDTLNQWLTFSLVGSFISILGIGMGTELSSGRPIDSLIHVSSGELSHLPPALPIMFLSLVYHDLIPFICSYLNGDATKIRQALVFGSVVPLVMFVSWEGVTLSFFENFAKVGGRVRFPSLFPRHHWSHPLISRTRRITKIYRPPTPSRCCTWTR